MNLKGHAAKQSVNMSGFLISSALAYFSKSWIKSE